MNSAERFLQDFHQRRPGTTPPAFAKLSLTGRGSSYDMLAATLTAQRPEARLLDLGCGDGFLLDLLAGHCPTARLLGVDMSATELEAAHTRLAGRALLLNERAQSLSLTSASVDAVLSHLALMLMSDIEQVLQEIHRVLVPGGQLSAVVGRQFLLGELGPHYLQAFRAAARRDQLAPLALVDQRTQSEDGWRQLLGRHFRSLHFEPLDLPWTPTFEELWDALGDTYDLDRLTPANQALMKNQLHDSTRHLQRADGTLPTGWGLWLIQARAA
ncbi:class I SAM-dependent methyltransferase [Pseudomonas sp. Au-Pse12]|uniref:class I SAM-dependent methyltransferase n=1 Tax=Pseudomonas sp. Au-Pse12 TaxID=2906459 RepID=UPI001E31E801|nr:class I SAM-dependent methyltransferase [Pseudomonas sp. Au-Pse12]MCE4053723.1 class I SAM-dependent methyltransferase [Pseudomonas sp. Au-Pse12]